MKIKKLLINACRVLYIIAVVVLLDHIFIPKYINENKDGRITAEFYREKTPTDVLAIGSSTMYNAVSPVWLWETQGFTSYVRANASQTMWQSYYLLEDAIRKQKPELVMVDMSFMKYGEEFVEEPSNRKTIDGMRTSLSKYRCIEASKWEGEQDITYLFPIFRYHSRWKELSADDLKYAFFAPEVTYNGYLMEFDIPEEQTIYEPEEQEDYSFPEKAQQYLDKIVALCEKEQIPLLLMKTPTYVNNWYDEYDENLKEYAKAHHICYENFDDYKEEMKLVPRTDYIDDGSHLNLVGAEKFSTFLGKYLRENYKLSDRSNEEMTAAVWKQKAERYESAKAEGMKQYQLKLKELGRDD